MTMLTNTWLYYASNTKADASRTFELAITENVIVRSVENSNGALIANVGKLKPGDSLILVFRGRKDALLAELDVPTNAHPRAAAVEVLKGELAKEIAGSDYELRNDDTLDVLLLSEVQWFTLDDDIPNLGQNTLHDITNSILEKKLREATAATSVKVIEVPTEDRQTLFDSYIMIDWSSRNEPTKGKDSIWVAHLSSPGTIQTINFSTRMECTAWLLKELAEKEKTKVSTLVGFDFAFGYPAGYLKVLGLTNWRDLLEYYATRVTDSKNNQHNRDDFARGVNQQLGRAPGPFWGVAKSGACDLLQTRRVGRFTFPYRVGEVELAEFRHTENAARSSGTIPQSVWKLNQGVAVGGQVIMGLPCLHKLLTKLNSIKAWPFETGWKVEPGIVIHLAEIFPSLISIDKYAAQIASGKMCRDEAQVRACCEFAYELDQRDQLEDYFRQPKSIKDGMHLPQYVEKEEGWILWSNLHEDH